MSDIRHDPGTDGARARADAHTFSRRFTVATSDVRIGTAGWTDRTLTAHGVFYPDDAKTPARRIYLPIMMMYLDGEASEEPYNEFALRMTEFMGAIRTPSILSMCVDISRDVAQGAYYKALIACRKLFELEQERLNYEP